MYDLVAQHTSEQEMLRRSCTPADSLSKDFTFQTHRRERSSRLLDSTPRGRRFEPHRRHGVLSLSKNNNPSLVLVQPMKTRPFITEILLMGRKESNQTNKNQTHW